MDFFASIPLDWIIVAIIVILLAFDSIRSGANRTISISLAFPLAFYLYATVPSAKFLSSLSVQSASPLLQSALFGAILLAVYLMLRHIIALYGRSAGLAQSIIGALAAAAIAVIFWLQIPDLQSIWHFGPQIQSVFGEAYKFWWLIGSYIALAFVIR